MMKIFKKTVIFISFAFVAALLITEVVLRVAYNEQLKTRITPLIYQPDSVLGYRYIPNVSAEINIPSIHKKFKINKNGFFGKSFEKGKKEGIYRIAIVGTSEASGIWMNSDKNFCFELQQLIDDDHIKAEVLNFSMDGRVRDIYNIGIVNNIVTEYKPDLVLLHVDIPFIKGSFSRCNYKNYVITFNNENQKSVEWCKAKIDYIESHRFLIGLYNVSYIVRAVCRYYMYHYGGKYAFNLGAFIERKIQAFDINFIPYSVKRTIEILKDTEQKLKSINSNFVLFYYSYNDYYKLTLDKNNFKSIFLDIPTGDNMLYENDSHYNEKAQKIIAEELFKHLKKNIIGDSN